MKYRTIDHNYKDASRQIDFRNKNILLRCDLNVPIQGGKILDDTRIRRIIPTIRKLQTKSVAKIILISHFGRPAGVPDLSYSLAPLTSELERLLDNPVAFGVDVVGKEAKKAVEQLPNNGIILMENLRFHSAETSKDKTTRYEFAKQIAQLGDIYVGDAFSCSHRNHASIVELAEILPSCSGELMRSELSALSAALDSPQRPLMAIIGGSKISTKLELLNNLVEKCDILAIGGAMANTLLKAQGYDIGSSLYEEELIPTAKDILQKSQQADCEILLPEDAIIAEKLDSNIPCKIYDLTASNINAIPYNYMMLDIGIKTILKWHEKIQTARTLVWNGPVGAFEYSPFNVGTSSLARSVAMNTAEEKLISVAGGGDTVAALENSSLSKNFTYISSAGGAFLEWLEGKTLPGIKIMQ